MLESAGHALIILIEQGFSGEKLSPLRYPLKVPILSCLRVPISDAPFVCGRKSTGDKFVSTVKESFDNT